MNTEIQCNKKTVTASSSNQIIFEISIFWAVQKGKDSIYQSMWPRHKKLRGAVYCTLEEDEDGTIFIRQPVLGRSPYNGG
jgi:hypothetical protein